MQEFILKNLITIIFIIFFIYGFIKGFTEGFLKKILLFGSLIVTIILTKIITPIVAEVIKDFTNIEATLSDLIYSLFIKNNAYDKFNFEGFGKIINTGDINNMLKENVCTSIANVIINLLCSIGVFVVLLIVIRLVIKILDIVDYIPVIGQINKIFGGVLGIFEVIVIAWVIFTVIRVLENIPQVKVIAESIEKSILARTIYENNMVFNFFSNLFSVFRKT